MGGRQVPPPILANCKEVGQNVSHSARELATVFTVTVHLLTIVRQMVKRPHSGKYLSTACMNT